MILGSFIVSLAFCPLGNTVCHWCPWFSWQKSLLKELVSCNQRLALSGDSFSCLWIHWPSSEFVPFTWSLWRDWFWDSLRVLSSVMITLNCYAMTTDSLRLFPVITKEIVWPWERPVNQAHLACHTQGSPLWNLYSGCLWYGACLWESLGYPDGGRKLGSGTNLLTTPASTLTSILTMGIRKYPVMGTVNNNVLWSLALVLLLMSPL